MDQDGQMDAKCWTRTKSKAQQSDAKEESQQAKELSTALGADIKEAMEERCPVSMERLEGYMDQSYQWCLRIRSAMQFR